MRVLIDGRDDIVSLDELDGTKLEEFMNELNLFVAQNKRIVTGIQVDGQRLTPPFVDDIFAKELTDIAEVSVETVPVSTLVIGTLDEVEVHLEEAVRLFKEASEIIYAQQYDRSASLIAGAVQKWRYSQQALDMITNLAIQYKLPVDAQALQEQYKAVHEVIVQLTQSLENSDFMMLKDVIDYELLDKFEDMKAQKQQLVEAFSGLS